jgi:hypothetical protein
MDRSAPTNPVTSLRACDHPLADPTTKAEDESRHVPASNRALWIVAGVALALSLSSFIYFYSHRMTNVYGDGVAHLNIARKVVDSPDASLWQRYMQIGSPWLPLQTALLLPLVANDWMWRTGVAGSIVSMLAFCIAGISLYLHARLFYRGENKRYRTVLPALAAAIFLLNPTVLYLQTTSMSEPIFIASLAGAAYLLQRWIAGQSSGRLVAAACGMTLATLARYEGWPIAALSILVVFGASRSSVQGRLRRAFVFAILVAVGPAYWLWHNWAIYGDALWFLTGPYSARSIYLQNQAALGWAKVFVGNAPLALLLMLSMVVVCVGPLLMIPAAVGFVRVIRVRWGDLVNCAPALLLLVPFIFHTMSLYRGEIQVFPLSAFGLLNVRYGLPHLLAAAFFAPAVVPLLDGLGRRWAVAVMCGVIALQYGWLISDGPSQLAIYQEGYRNGVNSRPARERARFSNLLKEQPPDPVILMHSGALGPVVSQSGLRFSDLIHEGTIRWHQVEGGIPKDVMTIVLQEGDPLDQLLRANPMLSRELTETFQERASVGTIKLFGRNTRSQN